MIFRNIIFSAVIVGLLSGIIYGLFQQLQLSPILYEAEQYEVKQQAVAGDSHTAGHHQSQDSHDHHQHDTNAWSPEDGSERIFWTMVANILTGISFALVMLSLMLLHNLKTNKPKLNAVRGLAWGIAGVLAIYVAPGLIGLQAEVPGTISLSYSLRQASWVISVIAALSGIAALYYLPLKYKGLGIIFAVTPYFIFGTSLQTEHTFKNTNPAAIAALTDLTQQFVIMTAIGTALFFLVLGFASGYVVKRYIKLDAQPG